MSEFHYVRTVGVDGGVDAVDGPAIGIDLESLLKDGLPPPKIALTIIAAMCEILDIADEDGEVHGDVDPRTVFLDDTGAVSIEGYGGRHRSRAPEGDPVGTATDLYGLGYTAYRLFAVEDIEDLPADPDDHDDTVIDYIIGINFGSLQEEFHGDVQWFLAKLMSWDPDDRPPAVEAWRTFIAFSDECSGPDIEEWAPLAIDGGGERRTGDDVKRHEAPADGEDLGGPLRKAGPLAKGAIDFSGGGAAGGTATAFWSKDAMKAALAANEDEEEDEEAAEPEFKPSVGGGSATAFWSKEQMEAMRAGSSEAPRPKRGGGKRGAPPKARPPGPPQQQKPGPPTGGPPQGTPAIAQGPGPQGTPPIAQGPGPQGTPPIAQGMPPIAQGPGPGPAYAPTEEEGGNGMMLAIAGVVVLVLLCGGLGLLGVGGFFVLGGDPEGTSSGSTDGDTDVDTERPEPVQDTAAPAPAPKPAPEPAAAPSPRPSPRPSPTTSPSPRPGPRPSPRPSPTPKPAPAPAPAPVTGPVRVTFNTGGRGTIGCSDGQQVSVDGRKLLTFEGYNMPVSCLLQIDGSSWAGLIEKGGTVSCSGSGAAFNCTGP